MSRASVKLWHKPYMSIFMNDKIPAENIDDQGYGEANVQSIGGIRGAFADGLTLIRVILTPVVMAVIIMGWPELNAALLATFLLIIAALTDIWDDIIGGSERSAARQFGWFDDIADIVLIIGTLMALLYVVWKNGVLGWAFAVPAVILIGREILVGLLKGYEFSKFGWPTTKWGWLKNTLTIFAVCILLASPWLTAWVDMQRIDDGNIVEIFDAASPHVWIAGQCLLWIAAIISALTGVAIIKGVSPEHDKAA